MIPSEFHEVDWRASLNVAEHLAAVPTQATIKGIFLRDLVTQAQRRNVRLQIEEGSLNQKDYPLRSYMSKLVEASRLMYPGMSERSSLRHLGRSVFPTFVDSLVGRAMLGVMGSDVVSIMKLANRAAAAAISTGHVATLKADAGEAVLHLRRVYFSDTYQIGVFEGMLDATKKRGSQVKLHVNGLDDIYLQVTWSDPEGHRRTTLARGA